MHQCKYSVNAPVQLFSRTQKKTRRSGLGEGTKKPALGGLVVCDYCAYGLVSFPSFSLLAFSAALRLTIFLLKAVMSRHSCSIKNMLAMLIPKLMPVKIVTS